MSAPTATTTPDRISTGVPGLDVVLCGGLIRGDLYLVRGASGGGKTVLGHQFSFSRAAAGGQVLYVTLLAEAHGRLVSHLNTFSFFRPEWIAQRVHYLSGYSALKEGGLQALLKLLGTEIHRLGADTLVIDGLGTAVSAAHDQLAMREFLHGVEAHSTLAGCTTLVTEIEGEAVIGSVEGQMDGILRLTLEPFGLRSLRSVEVLKFRGSHQHTGRHFFEITSEGMVVYPRAESLEVEGAPGTHAPGDRCGFGIPSFDAMMAGGLVRHSSTLLLGSPGSGKTLLGLHFLAEGARRGERGLYFGFSETREQLLHKAEAVSLSFEECLKDGRLVFDVQPPAEVLGDSLVQQVIGRCQQHQVRRLFIDDLEPFTRERVVPSRANDMVSALLKQLRSLQVTVAMVQQLPMLLGPGLEASCAAVEPTFDNLIVLRLMESESELKRRVYIPKMRDSQSDPRIRELQITTDGLSVTDAKGVTP